jgi:hypothetical protein
MESGSTLLNDLVGDCDSAMCTADLGNDGQILLIDY